MYPRTPRQESASLALRLWSAGSPLLPGPGSHLAELGGPVTTSTCYSLGPPSFCASSGPRQRGSPVLFSKLLLRILVGQLGSEVAQADGV